MPHAGAALRSTRTTDLGPAQRCNDADLSPSTVYRVSQPSSERDPAAAPTTHHLQNALFCVASNSDVAFAPYAPYAPDQLPLPRSSPLLYGADGLWEKAADRGRPPTTLVLPLGADAPPGLYRVWMDERDALERCVFRRVGEPGMGVVMPC